MQVRHIRTPPQQLAGQKAIDAFPQTIPRTTASVVPSVDWDKTTAHAVNTRPTEGQIAGAFNKASSGLAHELSSTSDNNAEAFARIGSLQTAFQYALNISQTMQASDTLRPLR